MSYDTTGSETAVSVDAGAADLAWVHPWERAGLGTAPFRVVGFRVDVYQACTGAPVQPAGACDVCGAGLKYVYLVAGSGRSDAAFRVGCDCVARTGDTELEQAARRARRAEADREYREAARGRAEARRALEREQAAENAVKHAGVIAELERLCGCPERGERAAKVFLEHDYGYDRYVKAFPVCLELLGDLREGRRDEGPDAHEAAAIDAVRRAVDAPESSHVGTPGERAKGLVCTYEGVAYTTSPESSPWGCKDLVKFLVAEGPHAGAWLLWWTTSAALVADPAAPFGGERRAAIGERVVVAATVDRHTDYKGCAQTEVKRVKCALPTPAPADKGRARAKRAKAAPGADTLAAAEASG
jgi:hypothetical protein